nr:hypothetical protein [uncultured Chryseobacterium sp.]
MLKDDQIKLTEEIILTAFRLLTNKLGQGGLVASNEAAFQLEFGHILKTLGQLYEFRLTDKFYVEFENSYKLNIESVKSKSKNARVDIFLKYQTDEQLTTAAIELKFFKKKNHREPNNRYDVFKDIHNLELYKQHGTDLCYFFVATDHDHYVTQSNTLLTRATLTLETANHIQPKKFFNIRPQNLTDLTLHFPRTITSLGTVSKNGII